MDKKDIIDFFDSRAATWDAEQEKNDEIIKLILDNAGLGADMDVLDVACGTGLMFEYYLKRGVASVTGIDLSPEMAKIAAQKFEHESRIKVICGDVEETEFAKSFDRIVVYNAFPHFPAPKRLIEKLAALLKPGGCLTVAHGASRETIDRHHEGPASKVSLGLMEAEELKKIFETQFRVDVCISDERMYQVCGTKA